MLHTCQKCYSQYSLVDFKKAHTSYLCNAFGTHTYSLGRQATVLATTTLSGDNWKVTLN